MKVLSLHIYPIKSCAGFEVKEAEVMPRGLAHDRRYMVVDAAGKFMTQRDFPKMALITPKVMASGLHLQAPGQPEIEIPVPAGSAVSVEVWKSSLELPVADDRANQWFSDFLGHPCRLVHLPDHLTRLATSRAF